MRTLIIVTVFCLIGLISSAQPPTQKDAERWQQHALNVTIIRDDFGVPHIYGKTDADAVFGLMYAQCEDDFKQVEYNYIRALGRASEIAGEQALLDDLWAHIYFDTEDLKARYDQMKPEMRTLMQAFADAINYYLFTHPQTKPLLLTQFEPWFALSFSEGSSEGNLANESNIPESAILRFLTSSPEPSGQSLPSPHLNTPDDPHGSNAIAIAPKLTKDGNTLFLINPHVDLFYRTEVHIVSEEGLNAYGAVSRGQFFVYHGFNEHCGWAHTTGYADTQDAFEETIITKDKEKYYVFGKENRKIESREKCLYVRQLDGHLEKMCIRVDYTHHGPVMANINGKPISITPLHQAEKELEQQWLMMKAPDIKAFTRAMNIRSNATNNTTYADDKGNIAYWHGNFIPKRDPAIDWNKPVPGDSRHEWKGIHSLKEIVHLKNPENGWIQNCNASPFFAAGKHSPVSADFPYYMATEPQNARGISAIRQLDKTRDFTMDKLQSIAFDNYLQAFETALPSLFTAYETCNTLPDSVKNRLAEPILLLRSWDKRALVNSVPTTIAVLWREKVLAKFLARFPSDSILRPDEDKDMYTRTIFSYTTAEEQLMSLYETLDLVSKMYGTWKVEAGMIFRFQRPLSGQDDFADDRLSYPLYFQSGRLGSLPAANYKAFGSNKRRYTKGGNSFVAIVEFGPRLVARSIVAGGQSSDPGSPHFDDQSLMYCSGKLKEVNFYKDDVLRKAERTYHPGE